MDQSLRYMGMGEDVHHAHHHPQNHHHIRGSSGHYPHLPPYPQSSHNTQIPLEAPLMFPHRSISLDTGTNCNPMPNNNQRQHHQTNGAVKMSFDTVRLLALSF